MAISGGDGSIILTTSVDTSGISRGSNSIKTMLQGVGNSAKATGAKIQSAFASFKGQRETFKALTQAIKDQQYVINSLNKEYADLVAKGKQNSTEAKKLKENINELEAEMRELQYSAKAVGTTSGTALGKLGAGLKKLASYLIGIHLLFSFINFSKEAGQLATQQEASVQRLIDIYGKASIAVGDFIDENARGLGLSKTVATSTVATYGNLLSVWADQKTNAELSMSLLNQTAVVASRTGRTVEDVAERIRSGLLGNTEAIEDLGINVNIKTIEITDAFKRIANGRSWEKLNAYEQAQVRTLAILEQSTKKYGTEVAKASAFTRQQYNAAFQDFQNTWGKVVNLVLMPILRIATRILNTLTAGLRVIAGLSGKTIDNNKQFEEQTEHIGGAVDNQEALTDAVKDTAKEQKKLLAGFDDLEILSQNASGNASNGAGVGGISGTKGLNVLGGEIDEAEYTSKLVLIGMVSGWALVGLGILLMFNGHFLAGIAAAGTGYTLIAGAAEGGKDLGKDEKDKLIKIASITGAALLGLGILLLFTKKWWKTGLAMAGTGAAAIYGAIELGGFSQDVKQKVGEILALTGLTLMILGTILLFVPGAEGVGLKMLADGAIEMFIAAAMNWEQVKVWLEENFWNLLYWLGYWSFILGIILCFLPGMQGFGFGAMIAGIGLMGFSKIVPNYDELKNEINTFFQRNWDLILGIAGALVVLGIILCIAQQWGYGLTAIGIGAALVWGVTVANWEEVKTGISSFVTENYNAIVNWANALFVIGVIMLFINAPIGFTLLGISGGMLWGATQLNSNELSSKLTTELDNVNKAAKQGVSEINTTLSSIGTADSTPFDVSLTKLSVPALAKGSVLPGGKPFMAIVNDQPAGQTNIEAPLQTIVDAFNIALQGNAYAGGGNTEVILEIDGREFGRAVVEQGNRENRRIGTRLVIA